MGAYGYRISGLEDRVVRTPVVSLSATRIGHPSSGMRALMLAVFEDAVRCYLTGTGRVRTEAEEWVHSVQRRSPFSFVVVCEILGLDPPAARTALRGFRDRQLSPTEAIGRTRPYARRTQRERGLAADVPTVPDPGLEEMWAGPPEPSYD